MSQCPANVTFSVFQSVITRFLNVRCCKDAIAKCVCFVTLCDRSLSLSNKPNYVILNNASANAARGVTNNECICCVFNIVHTHSCTTLIAVFISNNFKTFFFRFQDISTISIYTVKLLNMTSMHTSFFF